MCRLFGLIEVVSRYKLSATSVGDNCLVVPFVHMMLNYRLCQIIFNQRHLLLFLQYHVSICFYISRVYLFLYLKFLYIILHRMQKKIPK
jgi:hypothetical protein